MNRRKTYRIFIGPQEIAGYYTNLKRGFDSIGQKADLYEFKRHKSSYFNPESQMAIVSWIQRLSDIKRGGIVGKLLKMVNEGLKMVFMVICLFKYQVFIFGYGKTFLLNNRDLKILKFFGKKLIFNMSHGSEMRVPSMDGAVFGPEPIDDYAKSKELARLSKMRKIRAARIEKYADMIVGAPYSSAYYSEKKFINSFITGLPIDLRNAKTEKTEPPSRVRVLHCPSNLKAKGTVVIREVIKKIKDKGIDFDYVEVIGQPNEVVLAEIQKSTFIMDQLYSDIFLAGLATESAWYGKPSIVGGYGLAELKHLMKKELVPPSEICRPKDLQESIEKMILDEDYRNQLGVNAQKFVRERWVASEVANKYLRMIEGDVPEDWLFDPTRVDYMFGCAIEDKEVISNFKLQVENFGIESLMLKHRPEIEQKVLQYLN